MSDENLKPMSLIINDEFKQAIRDGATHIAVRFVEGPAASRGCVQAVGTKEECEAAFYPEILIVRDGEELHNEIWDADVVLPLILAEST